MNYIINQFNFVIEVFLALLLFPCVQPSGGVSTVVRETCPGDGPSQHSVFGQTG